MIPDEAVEAAAKVHQDLQAKRGHPDWEELGALGTNAQQLRIDYMRAALEAATPYIRAQEYRKLVNTWYRSLTPDDKVWCESRNPEEVRRMSKGKNCTYEKYETYEVTTGWEPWDK